MDNNFNLIISSWPSAGGSTAARILALVLNKKHIYAGGVLKAWVKAMGYDPKSNEINDWSEKYHDHWDYVWENYIKQKVQNSSNTIFEGKTAGFMLKNTPNTYKIYITASLQARMNRTKADMRIEEIQIRDKYLQKQWKKLFGFDLFDMQTLKNCYDYIIDTTNLNIPETAINILTQLNEQSIIQGDVETFIAKVKDVYEQYIKNSNYLMEEIEKRKLCFDPESIFKEIASDYPELIKDIPEEMKVVYNY